MEVLDRLAISLAIQLEEQTIMGGEDAHAVCLPQHNVV